MMPGRSQLVISSSKLQPQLWHKIPRVPGWNTHKSGNDHAAMYQTQRSAYFPEGATSRVQLQNNHNSGGGSICQILPTSKTHNNSNSVPYQNVMTNNNTIGMRINIGMKTSKKFTRSRNATAANNLAHARTHQDPSQTSSHQ